MPRLHGQFKDDHNAQAGPSWCSHMTATDSKPQAVHDTHDCNMLLCRHVEMLRDDMSLLKKEMQTSHADETAKADKAAAARSQSSSPVSHAPLLSIMTTNVCEPSQRRPVVLPPDSSLCTVPHCFVQIRRSLQCFGNRGRVMTVTQGYIQR